MEAHGGIRGGRAAKGIIRRQQVSGHDEGARPCRVWGVREARLQGGQVRGSNRSRRTCASGRWGWVGGCTDCIHGVALLSLNLASDELGWNRIVKGLLFSRFKGTNPKHVIWE